MRVQEPAGAIFAALLIRFHWKFPNPFLHQVVSRFQMAVLGMALKNYVISITKIKHCTGKAI